MKRWGAMIDGNETFGPEYGDAPWDSKTLFRFEEDAGRKVSEIHFGQPFGVMDLNACLAVHDHGATPWVTMGSGGYSMLDIANGAADTHIIEMAKKINTLPFKVMIRLWWEMNGTDWGFNSKWYRHPSYVDAWRHVYTLTNIYASNARFVWCPNVFWDPASLEWMHKSWPGSEYVDWAGLDGYNWSEPWRWAGEVFNPSLEVLRSLDDTMPVMICETACRERGGSKAKWIDNFLNRWLPKHNRVKGFLWFNWAIYHSGRGERLDWPIESSETAQHAFQRGINNGQYA